MKHIGIVGVNPPGAALCYEEISKISLLKHDVALEISINSLPFDLYKTAMMALDWRKIADLILASIKKLALLGVEIIIIPANTVHFAIEDIKKNSPVPVLSILNTTINWCIEQNYSSVVVLGTKQTMRGELYTKILSDNAIMEVTITESLQDDVHRLIMEYIIPGNKNFDTLLNSILEAVKKIKCDAVILACTELPLVMDSNNVGKPIVDTTRLLAIEAVKYSAILTDDIDEHINTDMNLRHN
ncbi:MAG: aspartate/glutamate racemase family protein [Proteobacteria bacterium]|nr:aspartate/glutamate racemase family protein [Pseudomonadota bacterium]